MIELVIDARRKDLGGFEVGRVLPFHARRMVGPFIFLDQMGPAEFAPGATAIDVRPHPHIGLSTLTYLFEGEIMHHDNLGYNQAIRPGEVNWMTAGRGIVHSERTDPLKKSRGGPMHGMQAWVALPTEAEEVELEINPKDLRIDTFRSSGAGGQHINKTSSAIRVTHLPTGMVVECQDQRSQRENKDRALKVLRSRLLQQKQDAYDEEYNARRQSQVGSGDRSEKIRTYNFPQDRVTDHRIGLTLRNLQGVLDGDLDRVVEPLILADREEKLKQSSTEEGK